VSAHSCAQPGCDLSKEPPIRFIHPDTAIPSGAVCRYCKRDDGVIAGDGLPVCRTCIAKFAEVILHPDTNVKAAEELAGMHADVVTLIRLVNGSRRWQWTAGWPGPERRVGGA
jgi:hypothetical protein